MADAVTTQILTNGERTLTLKFTNISDGTGEAAVTKVAAATYGTNLRIMKIHYSTFGMGVQILWDATADVLAWYVPADSDGCLDFTSFGGIQNNGGDGVTGNIQFTTVGHTANDVYSIMLELRKS
jgi:hypothetical protein